MTQLTDKHWAVEVPDDLLSPEFCFEQSIERMLGGEKGDDELVIRYRERVCGSPIGKHVIALPPGTYRFLFTTATATEEDARKVVETIHIEEAPSPWNDFAGGWDTGYVDYENRGEFAGYQGDAGCFRKALESLRSLLRSKNLDPKNNYAIIEKMK